jgi:hypothetical protein
MEVATNRVNDFEIGTRRSELKEVRDQIRQVKYDPYMKPDLRSRMLRGLRDHFQECKEEYDSLCKQVRLNYI